MIGNMLGEDIPAVGFSIGFERISEILLSGDEIKFQLASKKLALLYEKENPIVEVVKKADALRDATEYDVSTMLKAKKLGKQLSSLEKEGFEAVSIFGESEIRMLTGGEQEK
jgi:histidyl-tRNA synthetase